MLELGAHLQAANETKNERESCSDSREGCEKELEGVKERIERNETRVSTSYCYVRYEIKVKN